MQFLDYFRRNRQKSASVAKDRLQIIVARERGGIGHRDYLPELHQELLQVIAKYEAIDHEKVTVNLDRNNDVEVLELNIVLPNVEASAKATEELPQMNRRKSPVATAKVQKKRGSSYRDWR